MLPEQAENYYGDIAGQYNDVYKKIDPTIHADNCKKLSTIYLWQDDYHKSHIYDVKFLESTLDSSVSDFDKGRFTYTYLLAIHNRLERDGVSDDFIEDQLDPRLVEASNDLIGGDTQNALVILDDIIAADGLPEHVQAWLLSLSAELHQAKGDSQKANHCIEEAGQLFVNSKPRDQTDISLMPYLTYRTLLISHEHYAALTMQRQLAHDLLAYFRMWDYKYYEKAMNRIIELYEKRNVIDGELESDLNATNLSRKLFP